VFDVGMIGCDLCVVGESDVDPASSLEAVHCSSGRHNRACLALAMRPVAVSSKASRRSSTAPSSVIRSESTVSPSMGFIG
jgi:hypothetical protein